MLTKTKSLIHLRLTRFSLSLIGTMLLAACGGGAITSTPTGQTLPAPSPAEIVYRDPQGWYTISPPAGWSRSDEAGRFEGEDGFVETGYLPEMGYLGSTVDVCQWLANIDFRDQKPAQVSIMANHHGCDLRFPSWAHPVRIIEVIQNPVADPNQRFLYIDADATHFNSFSASFSWLKPVPEEARFDFSQATLKPEDEAFWNLMTGSSTTEDLSVTEYNLTEDGQNKQPYEEILLDFIPPEVKQQFSQPLNPVKQYYQVPDTLEKANAVLAAFGYNLSEYEAHIYRLYRNGELLLENIYRLPKIYLLPTPQGDRLVFKAYSLKDTSLGAYSKENVNTYLVQDDTVTLWEENYESPMDPGRAPIYCGGEVLWLQATGNTGVTVLNSRHELVYDFSTYFGTHLPVEIFTCWQDHWILEVSDFVIQDGIILNQAFGYEGIFDWHLIDGKPLYFFRNGARVGINYDGRILPVWYHDVAHAYCCGYALNNPFGFPNSHGFFANRAGAWYYEVLETEKYE
jgi:hypothetical protein